jgi:hypothetical protein
MQTVFETLRCNIMVLIGIIITALFNACRAALDGAKQETPGHLHTNIVARSTPYVTA